MPPGLYSYLFGKPVPGIGIVATNETEAAQLGINGIVVVRTLPDAPADKTGLAGGSDTGVFEDVINAVNGEPVHSMSDLPTVLDVVGIGKSR